MRDIINSDFLSLLPLWMCQTFRSALVKFGGGITAMSGSIAGNTFARNRFGSYTRSRTKPVNPRSVRQSAARILIMMLAEQWREPPMDDDKRGAWGTYADSVNWNNRLGEIQKLTGFNMFIRGNAARIAVGGDLVTDGPTDLGLPAGDEAFAVVANATKKKLIITFNDTQEWCDEDGAFMSIEMGVPQNETRNFFNGPWRIAGGIAGSSISPPTTGVEIDPPFTLVPGQKVWCRASIIRADARASTKFRADPVLVTGPLYKLGVTGNPVPDCNGTYTAKGLLADKPYYKHDTLSWYIWWNDDDVSWYISPILGAAGIIGHYTRENANVVGAFVAVAPASGVPTVADIS